VGSIVINSVFELIDLNKDINDVGLYSHEGYSLAMCDYGVLDDNDFIEVLIESLPVNIQSLKFVFFDFVAVNKLKEVFSFEINLQDEKERVWMKLEEIRKGYRGNFDGTVSSRYAIFDKDKNIFLIVEDSVPLTKIFYKTELKKLIDKPLLSEYTFEEKQA